MDLERRRKHVLRGHAQRFEIHDIGLVDHADKSKAGAGRAGPSAASG